MPEANFLEAQVAPKSYKDLPPGTSTNHTTRSSFGLSSLWKRDV